MKPPKLIYTIGHSTHSIEEFLAMLQSFNIETLADIRNFPGSKRFPHFNSDTLARSLQETGIHYQHFKALGGRRKPLKDSKNTGWRLAAFRGYADYMETPEFQQALTELQSVAESSTTAYMCSEAVWWSCHRSLVSDQLKNKGWKVLHIMKAGKADEHPYTKPARIVNGVLTYPSEDLFSQNL
jgi:uncharacterized protein (DUF488 family)